MRLPGAHISGSLHLTGAHIESRTAQAVDLPDAVIEASVFVLPDSAGRRPVIRGRIDMRGARVSGLILIRDVVLEGGGSLPWDHSYPRARKAGTAVSAPHLSVGGEVTFEGRCEVTGGLDLPMSEMSAFTIAGTASLLAPERTALDLTSAQIRSSVVLEPGASVAGTTRLNNAAIGGYLSLRGVTLTSPEQRDSAEYDQLLVAAEGATVSGDVDLRDLYASGGRVDFRSAHLGGAVNATRARLTNEGGTR